jgi:hypothetical protein
MTLAIFLVFVFGLMLGAFIACLVMGLLGRS